MAPPERWTFSVDRSALPVIARLRPTTWAVLQVVVLEADLGPDGLVAATSARAVASLAGLDPGTAASALRRLRAEGLIDLRRGVDDRGRFGLSSYALGDLTTVGMRPCATGPHVAQPGAVDAHAGCPSVPATAPASTAHPMRSSTTEPAVTRRPRAGESGRSPLPFDLGWGSTS